MQEHKTQDTAIISAITSIAFVLILLLFGKSVQAGTLSHPQSNTPSSPPSMAQAAPESYIYASNKLTESENVNLYIYTIDGDQKIKQFFSY